MTVSQAPTVSIGRINTQRILVHINGTSPLIVHKFSQKAKQQMLDAQQGKKKTRVVRDPEAEFEASLYRLESGYGFPATAFKMAIVGASRFYGKDVKMTELRQALFVKGTVTDLDPQPLVQIFGQPRMREDTVRVGMGSADLRYRAEFPAWSAVLDVTFVASMLSLDSVLSLIDAGGMGVGVGEWRPERKGDFGTYEIDHEVDVQVVA